MEDILRHQTVMDTLTNYPKSQWTRAVTALLLYGIEAVKKDYNLDELTVKDLERLAENKPHNKPSSSNKSAEITMLMKELSTIKKEISRLDHKMGNSHRAEKENTCPNPDEAPQSVLSDRDINRYVVAKPSNLWRTSDNGKKRRGKGKSHSLGRRAQQQAQQERVEKRSSTAEERKKDQPFSPSEEPVRRKKPSQQPRKTVPRNARTLAFLKKGTGCTFGAGRRRTGKLPSTDNYMLPSYLQGVQSRIRDCIENHKRNYRMHKQAEAYDVRGYPPPPQETDPEYYYPPGNAAPAPAENVDEVPEEDAQYQPQVAQQYVPEQSYHEASASSQSYQEPPREQQQQQYRSRQTIPRQPSASLEEQQQLPTLGRQEGRLAEVANQCMSGVADRFAREEPRPEAYSRPAPTEVPAPPQEESARFRYSPGRANSYYKDGRQEGIHDASEGTSLNQRIPSKDDRARHDQELLKESRYQQEANVPRPNEGRVLHYSEAGIGSSDSTMQRRSAAGVGASAEDYGLRPRYYAAGESRRWVQNAESSVSESESKGPISSSGSSLAESNSNNDYDMSSGERLPVADPERYNRLQPHEIYRSVPGDPEAKEESPLGSSTHTSKGREYLQPGTQPEGSRKEFTLNAARVGQK